MTQYEVKKEGGVEVNGTHYDEGHVFEFDAVPEYVQPLVDSGDVAEVAEVAAEEAEVESPKDEGAESSDGSAEVGNSAQDDQKAQEEAQG